jgi:hypothetical protein
VITLTYGEKRNTRCTLLLLILTGGRVMGSNDQMTLLQAFGPLICAAERAREERRWSWLMQTASRRGSRHVVSREIPQFTSGRRVAS